MGMGSGQGETQAPREGKVKATQSLPVEHCQQALVDKTLAEASKPQQANCN